MAEYYFMSQLPSLDGIDDHMSLPITEERFLELCHRFLGKKAQREMEKLSLMPPRVRENSGSALIETWNEGERNLRLALAKVRAEKMKKPFDIESKNISPELLKTVHTAVDMENPLEAEYFLNRHRLNFLESIRPMDIFSEESVFYYGLKLKLLSRMRRFDAEIGKALYKKNYDLIMNGERLEATK
ncbi:MAG: hypothetical protein E7393_03840 [Ruminococcaceae bacterium]|nr:hypothetical protein [Oscillospiraceae bacterium]